MDFFQRLLNECLTARFVHTDLVTEINVSYTYWTCSISREDFSIVTSDVTKSEYSSEIGLDWIQELTTSSTEINPYAAPPYC